MNFNFKEHFRGIISVIGGSEIDKKTENIAIEIGRLLALNHYAVSCGGLSGVMEAVCKGAKQENGLTIGIIPHKTKSVANEFVDIVIPVPFSQARNVVVVLSGDACIAIGGKAGTLSEMCFAWIYQKPIVAISNIEGWSSKLKDQKIDDRRLDMIYGADTPKQAIDKINELLKSTRPNDLSFTDNF
ncbi:MAG: TIGR00725 family protein [Promethearchaeota archaeon]|nr:MAG: TIGR00725 family protein [Candidatus Lokiarchaeota archaeon]